MNTPGGDGGENCPGKIKGEIKGKIPRGEILRGNFIKQTLREN